MKKIYFLLGFLCLSAMTFAQSIGPFQVSKLDFSVGTEQDRIEDFSSDYFVAQLANGGFEFEDIDFREADVYGGVCENPYMRLGLSLSAPNVKRLEWRNAVVWMPNRVDAITLNDDVTGQSSKFINFNQTQHEIAIESAMLFDIIDLGPFNLYGGIGSNAGVTYGNRIDVFGSDNITVNDINMNNAGTIIDEVRQTEQFYSQSFKTTPNFNHRVFLQAGASIIFFKAFELGFDVRTGRGYRTAANAPTSTTKLISAGFTARVML